MVEVALNLIDGHPLSKHLRRQPAAEVLGVVSLSAKEHIHATGYLRDASYSESPTTSLRKAKQFDRIQDRDDERRVGRVATYVVVKTLIQFRVEGVRLMGGH